mmetsp:Transcript_58805/g.131078  ORF Transcript_58805/g.131078 Transcript_58805/m.131078 type:complete len:201 (-) Transcript_58805:1067-1669(-)
MQRSREISKRAATVAETSIPIIHPFRQDPPYSVPPRCLQTAVRLELQPCDPSPRPLGPLHPFRKCRSSDPIPGRPPPAHGSQRLGLRPSWYPCARLIEGVQQPVSTGRGTIGCGLQVAWRVGRAVVSFIQRPLPDLTRHRPPPQGVLDPVSVVEYEAVGRCADTSTALRLKLTHHFVLDAQRRGGDRVAPHLEHPPKPPC